MKLWNFEIKENGMIEGQAADEAIEQRTGGGGVGSLRFPK